MALFIVNTAQARGDVRDVAAIETLIESVGVLADQNEYDTLEKLFAAEVEVDYTSLFGGEKELKSPQALMTAWASSLPGFDRTRHNISHIVVDAKTNTATATADVTASHWVGDSSWDITGTYEFGLVREGSNWNITKLVFNRASEKGNRDALAVARERAVGKRVPYIVRQQTQQVVLDFLHALEIKDMTKFATVWADDAVQDMPYSPEGFPKRVNGKEAILQLFSGWPETAGKVDFTSQLVFYPMQNPEIIFVEFKGDVEVIPTGKNYRQVYGGLFHVQDEKIKLYREYYDPAPFKEAFNIGQ